MRAHYVPQFYLAGFTDQRTGSGVLHVADVQNGTVRPGSPKNEAAITDFYRLDSREAPEAAESALSAIEDATAPIIREIEDTLTLPPDQKRLATLLMFMAVQHNRVPRVRRKIEDFYGEIGHTLLALVTRTPEAFDQTIKGIEAATGTSMARASREDLVAALPNIKFGVDQTTLVGEALATAEAVLVELARRRWILVTAASGVPDFVTCDNPVVLVPTRAALETREARFRLSLSLDATTVLYPLTARLALCGTREGRAGDRSVVAATFEQVTAVNCAIVLAAERFVYSRRPRVYHKWDSGLRTRVAARG
jgi:hypothetical protein